MRIPCDRLARQARLESALLSHDLSLSSHILQRQQTSEAMSAAASTSEFFIFLIDAPEVSGLWLEGQFRNDHNAILRTAQQFKNDEGEAVVWLWMTYDVATGATGEANINATHGSPMPNGPATRTVAA
ncbi:hypothetical protein QFC20_002604 [Naganishia adeliensis]|uniref:Uncharacterized protein n=1 Tax=Naganishia adeliensis TaxID=92952 RepID=A0ACC2WIL2_9TREE|nr:hypothetical protein QFC20_002604 [Naganishia adeliensis]